MGPAKRFIQIDFIRGLTVILMVIFNWSFTLSFLNAYSFAGGCLYWFIFPRLIGGSFIFLAGIPIILSYKRLETKLWKIIFRKYSLRGLKLFLIGLGITLLTWLLFPQYTVFFGILHLIGLSIMLSPFFLGKKIGTLYLGSIIIILGFYIQSLSPQTPLLLWLGLAQENFQTFDYWPLLPWFGVFLLGMFTGETIASRINNIQGSNTILKKAPLNLIAFLGRKSLIVYLVHQPILVTILYFFGFKII